MLFGQHRYRKNLAYLASWCTICHSVQAHRYLSLNLAGYLMFIRLNPGQLLCYEIQCLRCQTPNQTEHNSAVVNSAQPPELARLIQQTLPDYPASYAAQLALAHQVSQAKSSLSPQQRLSLIEQALLALNYKAELYFYGGTIRFGNIGILLLCLFVIGGSQALLQQIVPAKPVDFSWALALLAGIFSGTMMEKFRLRRFLRRKILPPLRLATAHLYPSPAEIDEVLDKLRQQDKVLAQLLTVKQFD